MATGERAVGVPLTPVVLAGLTTVTAVIITVLGFGTLPWWFSVVGYVFGALVTVVFTALYRSKKASRRSRRFRPSPGVDRIVASLTAVGLLAGIVCAFQVATEVAKW